MAIPPGGPQPRIENPEFNHNFGDLAHWCREERRYEIEKLGSYLSLGAITALAIGILFESTIFIMMGLSCGLLDLFADIFVGRRYTTIATELEGGDFRNYFRRLNILPARENLIPFYNKYLAEQLA